MRKTDSERIFYKDLQAGSAGRICRRLLSAGFPFNPPVTSEETGEVERVCLTPERTELTPWAYVFSGSLAGKPWDGFPVPGSLSSPEHDEEKVLWNLTTPP